MPWSFWSFFICDLNLSEMLVETLPYLSPASSPHLEYSSSQDYKQRAPKLKLPLLHGKSTSS